MRRHGSDDEATAAGVSRWPPRQSANTEYKILGTFPTETTRNF